MHGEGHALSCMADRAAECFDRMMRQQDIALRMRGVGLLGSLKAGAIDAHVAGLAAIHAHKRLVEVRGIQSIDDDLLDLGWLGHSDAGQHRPHDGIHALLHALIV